MTDRAQPGAISSVIRNDELAQALDSFTQGGIVSGSNPTDASVRRSDIDETALDAFSLSSSASSLNVTVGPGEAFVAGWLCRDTSTTLTLPANATTDIVIGHDIDAVFDPTTDPDRDAADEVIVDLSSNVTGDIPQIVAHRVETDGSGVTSAGRIATVGGFSEVATGDLAVSGSVTEPLTVGNIDITGEATGINTLINVKTEADLPAIDPPQIAFIRDKNEYQRSINSNTFDLSNVTFQDSISTEDSIPKGLAFSDDGKTMFEIGQNSELIYQSSLSTAFDLGSASFQKDISTQDQFPGGITFSNDGKTLFEGGRNDGEISQSSLSTAFDIGSATLQKEISTQGGSPTDVVFNDDGTALFVVDFNSASIEQSSLSTAFDIGTATFQKSISAQDTRPTGLAFSNDGKSMFEIGNGSDLIYELSLSTAFDIGTASFERSIQTQDLRSADVTFDTDGTKLFEMGGSSDEIYESTSGVQAGFRTF
jgi:3'-phosphoadenosine 5'-phosphosulfate sulfotransferase